MLQKNRNNTFAGEEELYLFDFQDKPRDKTTTTREDTFHLDILHLQIISNNCKSCKLFKSLRKE